MTILLTIRELHIVFALFVIGINALAAVLAFGVHRTNKQGGRLFWIFIAVAQTTVFVQAILGAVLQSNENLAPRDFHYLYGFSMIVFIALLYGYRLQVGERRYLLYGFGSLFIMGLGIRAFFIGV
ncbi:MAG: hypothetical protein CL470_01765 [Acidimicrobiaceae bacterium]|nr:hypothetical protein [Acidimicrobiaceae bacterium]